MTTPNDQLDNVDRKRIEASTRLRTGRRMYAALLAAQALTLPMAVFGPWAVDGDGANTNGGGFVGTGVTLTEQGSTLAKVYDDSATEFQDLATSSTGAGYTANYQMLPDTSAVDDFVAFGAAVPFAEVAFDIDTVADYTAGAIVWEYPTAQDTWATLTIAHDGTGSTGDGTDSFEQDGAISFVPPADWAQTTVDSVRGYWIRCRVTTGLTTEPTTNSKEHELVTAADAWVARAPGQVTGIRASSGAATLGSTTATKFILINQTTGAHSGELTWALSTRVETFSDLNVPYDTGDELAVIVTQEDGTAEHDTVLFELQMANPQQA